MSRTSSSILVLLVFENVGLALQSEAEALDTRRDQTDRDSDL